MRGKTISKRRTSSRGCNTVYMLFFEMLHVQKFQRALIQESIYPETQW
jgi:hypothetical protein